MTIPVGGTTPATSRLGPAERQAAVDAAPIDELDLVVVGGGVVGAGVALDAVTRGLSEDMVELVLRWRGTLKAEHGTGRIMAPFVRRQYGDELYDVMVQVKRLFDPAGILNPGVVISDDATAHLSHLKTMPTVEEEVDRCVECGFCEPVCPSKDLTLTPRTRIVLRREIARARTSGDAALAEELEADYAYEGIDTCAVDGMCQTACPVLIDTGSLVTRLRRERQTSGKQKVWLLAAQHWHWAGRLASTMLTTAGKVPPALPTKVTRGVRRLVGEEAIPAWTPDLPKGGRPRHRTATSTAARPVAVHFASCVGSVFAPHGHGLGASSAFSALCQRAGVELAVPPDINTLCCATPWKSKGLSDGYAQMRERLVSALRVSTEGGRLPVVCDASSCTEGLVRTLGGADGLPGARVVDALTFAASELLPRLPEPPRVSSAAVHPTCSTTRLGLNDALSTVAETLAERVVVPHDWGCCAFAGDRGMLHPELTASATAREAREVQRGDYDLYLSANRTCEMALTRATGAEYQHALEALERATRPPEKPA